MRRNDRRRRRRRNWWPRKDHHLLRSGVAKAPQEDELYADKYSFTVEFASFSDIDQATAGGDQLCIFKGTDKEPDFQPVWVSTTPALSTQFEWEVQYGVYATDQDYEDGVTITAKSWQDADLSGCYALNDKNGFDSCTAVGDDEIRLKNTKTDPTALWTMGLYQKVLYTGGTETPGYTQPFFSKQLLANSGTVTVKPKQEVTVGMCSYSTSTLADSDDLSGACVISVDTSGSQVVAFDSSSNTFLCPSSSSDLTIKETE